MAISLKAFNVLYYLVTHPDRLITKDTLLDAVWAETAVSDAVVRIAIGELRRVVTALGYRAVIEGEQVFFIGRPRRRDVPEKIRQRTPRDGHPFAKLKELNFA